MAEIFPEEGLDIILGQFPKKTGSGGISPSGCVVTGNRAFDNRGTKYMKYGLLLSESGGDTVTNATVHSNDFSGCGSGDISDSCADAYRQTQATEGWELREVVAAPSAPASNRAVLFARDNGSGKTQIAARFPSGAVQTVATEP